MWGVWLVWLVWLSLSNAFSWRMPFLASRSVWGLAGRYATICPAGFAAMLVPLACFSAGLRKQRLMFGKDQHKVKQERVIQPALT